MKGEGAERECAAHVLNSNRFINEGINNKKIIIKTSDDKSQIELTTNLGETKMTIKIKK